MINNQIKEKLESIQFSRYCYYLDVREFVQKKFHSKQFINPRIIEFGGSNEIIKKIFNCKNYTVADNYPKVDIQNLKDYESNCYDFVILDQILEHVAEPNKALNEIYRILKKSGWLIIGTPFLVPIHPAPNDYWRFTKEGMKKLLYRFLEVILKSWGNKELAKYYLDHLWYKSAKEIRQSGKFNLKNEEEYPIVIWGYARK
ncbi:class I SAM-dependent methyltransferase [Candidatus Woesearchaeota archaeon]|nr:class I SAM-dependent methyltransferase [Candidatus Woesearchaeota archaeon]